MSLRLASKDTIRITVGEDDGWLDVRKDISRRQFNALISSLPEDYGQDSSITLSVASDFSTALFSAFVIGWSVEDENGNPLPVTEDNYQELERQSAQLIDSAISEHFNALSPDEETTSKSKANRK